MAHSAYRCYAKINLTLEIVRRRADGFHDLASLVHTVSLADDLRISAADRLLSHTQGMQLDDETNLVSRAARLLASTANVRAGAELALVKRIPAAAGLGGGSSDAATALVGLNTLWGTRLSLAALSELAAELGSDVPFFMRGGAALMRGRGDDLQVLPPLAGLWLVVVVPAHEVENKTKRLYSALDPGDFSNGEAGARAADRLSQHQLLQPDDLVNGFARAARATFVGLAQTWAEVERVCDRRFYLSGAGPAIFGLAEDRADARRQQLRLGRRGWSTYAVRTVGHARASVKLAACAPIGYP